MPKSNLSRRQFLAHSAGIAGVSMGLAPVGAGDGRADGRLPSLGIGFIGVGDRGLQLLRTVCQIRATTPQIRVAAICDVDPKHLRRGLDFARARHAGRQGRDGDSPDPSERSSSGSHQQAPQGFTNFRALLDAPGVDAVVIATPPHLHVTQVLTALAAGKNVYCEKPMATSLEDCRAIVSAADAAEEKGRVFQVGFQRRFNPRYEKSVQHLRGGNAGPVLFIRSQWHTTSPGSRSKPWLHRQEKSGGIVLEQASHQFDVFNWIFGGPPLRACGFGGLSPVLDGPMGRDTLDHYSAVLEYEGGAKVHMSHLTFAVPERRFSGIQELAFGQHQGVDLANAAAWNSAGKSESLGAEKGNETERAVVGFLESVAAGRPSSVGASLGYEAALAALLCQRALDTGKVALRQEMESV